MVAFMDVLTEDQHRALAFVAAANAGGYAPRPSQVDAWVTSPFTLSGTVSVLARQLAHFRTVTDTIIEGGARSSVSDLLALDWVSVSRGGARLTDLGKALLRAADAASDEVIRVVMLQQGDPLAYATLIGELAAAGDAMLIDPYLDLKGCADVLEHTRIRRILIGHYQSAKKKSGIAVYLAGAEREDVKIRVSDVIHDRLVIDEGGGVCTIGTSLNGVARAKTTTVLTPMPALAADALRDHAEGWWDAATPLSTQPEVEDGEEASAQR